MSKITLLVATKIEFQAASSVLQNWKLTNRNEGTGSCGQNQIQLFCIGMGPKNARDKSNSILSNNNFEYILVTGLAGALNHNCKIGDAIIYQKCGSVSNNLSDLNCNKTLSNALLKKLHAENKRVHCDKGITTQHIVYLSTEKEKLGKTYNAIAIDMESYSIAEVALSKGYKIAILRIISDEVSHNLPNFNMALDEKNNFNSMKLISCLCSSPLNSIKFLLSLQRSLKHFKELLKIVLSVELA